MKKIQHTFRNTLVLIFALLLASFNSVNSKEVTESFEKSYPVNKTDLLILNTYDSDVIIYTWDKAEIKIKGEIIASGSNEEDLEDLIRYFKGIEGEKGPHSLEFETNFIKGRVVIMGIGRTILRNGDRLNVSKVKTNFTFWVPKEIGLRMEAKYNNTKIPTITGDIDVEVYDGKLEMGDIGNEYRIKLTYSDGFFGNGGSGDIELYESELEMGTIQNVELSSKYSEINIQSIKELDLHSYEDKISFGPVEKMKAGAKYTNIDIEGALGSSRVDFYESELTTHTIDEIDFTGKYSKVNTEKIGIFESISMYECKIDAEVVSSFSCQDSKYDEVFIRNLMKSVSIREAYEIKFIVDQVDKALELFEGDFKYGTVSLDTDESMEFELDFSAKYADVDIPRERFKNGVTIIKESSNYTIEGETAPNAVCKMKVTGYDFNFSIH